MKEQAGTYCMVFPNYRDFHFFKDPGQIPYRFSKLGYNASIICYGESEDFAITGKYLKVVGIPDRYITRKFNSGIVRYLIRNAKKIDILHTFHYSWSSLLFTFVYKTFNRKGFAYLKLDHCAFARTGPDKIGDIQNPLIIKGSSGIKGSIKSRIAERFFTGKVDLWSIEDEYSRELLEASYGFLRGKLITVYNGHTSDLQGSEGGCRSVHKEDIIMTAGRLGTLQKATEMLLDAFKSIALFTGYDLHLAGTVEPGFQAHIDRFLHDNPSLNKRVFFHGPLNRDELRILYCRSRIFCLPSKFEGMAVVFPEAMSYGNAIVTTEDVSLKPMIEKYGFGLMVERDDARALANAVIKLVDEKDLIDEMADRARRVSMTLLNWDNIVNGLRVEIEKKT